MLSRMFKVYAVISITFHKWFSPLLIFFVLLFLRLIVFFGMILDYLFFPSLWKKKIEKPIVVVGNPRSGTTFLHRFLVDNGFGVGMPIWKMIYPSLVMQKCIKPLLPFMEKVSPTRFHAAAAHKTGLMAVETEDPAFLFHFFDGFFLYGFLLAWAKKEMKDMFDPAVRDTSKRDFDWLENIWKRNLMTEKNDRVVGKIFSLSTRIPQFLKKYPDAKILYINRDPIQTVPSGLSLVTGVLDGWFGFWNLPKAKRDKFIERLYNALLDLNLGFHKDYKNGLIPKDTVMLVPYSRIMKDFDTLMREILQFLDCSPSAEVLKTIEEISDKQKKYVSKHIYDLEKFGLDEERIKRDYAVIYKDFF